MNEELRIKNFEYQTKKNMFDPRSKSFLSGGVSSVSSSPHKRANMDM